MLGTVFRVVGTPLVALVGLVNTAIIVRETGEAVFGLVSLVTTFSLLLPFADLGIGAVVTTACSRRSDVSRDPLAVSTIQRGFRVLILVAVLISTAGILVMATNSWAMLLGSESGPADRIAITVAVVLFAAGLPMGLGLRILIGMDLNHIAVLLTMTNSVFTLGSTLLLGALHVSPIWFAVSGAAGALAGNTLALAIALRRSGVPLRTALRRPEMAYRDQPLLAGSLWIFVASVGLPLGLQSHRIILSHVSSPAELSRYALMAQVYAIAWMVFSTAGMALWPVFVKRRSDSRATLSLLLRAVAVFGALAAIGGIVISVFGPWATSLLSGDELVASRGLAIAFSVLLFVQCLHLPAGVMLTTPREARFQSYCIMAMGILGVTLGIWWGRDYGGVGVVLAATLAVAIAQLIPDIIWIPGLLKKRRDVDWHSLDVIDDRVAASTPAPASDPAVPPRPGRHRREP